MKKIISTLMVLAAIGTSQAVPITGTHTFELGDDAFILDGKPFIIRCAEMHFARVPPEYWRHRIQMVKACGFNAVCAYMFWNYHEPREGEFLFDGDRDIKRFCEIAQEEGMWVVLRPGPYTCAEWEFGGLPWWLMKDPTIKLRSLDPKYIGPATRYLTEVAKQLVGQQITHGGNILMVQCENEYGFWGNDKEYMRSYYPLMRKLGFDVPLFCCNPAYALKKGYCEEYLPVVNFGANPENAFNKLKEIHPTGPRMCGEYYPAWFDSWGERHNVKSTRVCIDTLDWMLAHGCSFSVYMAHGGTSFGWWAGCNAPFRPQTSSYDYEAPVNESGKVTRKFFAMRDLFAKYPNAVDTKFPEPAAPIPTQAAVCKVTPEYCDIWTAKGDRTLKSEHPMTFESADFGYGYAIYRTTLPAGAGGEMKADVRDLGVVKVDGEVMGYFDRRYPKDYVRIAPAKKARKLEILVEQMGRYNFGQIMQQSNKGIIGEVRLAGVPLTGWTMTVFDLMGEGMKGIGANYTVTLEGGKDTFLDMHDFKRGMVCVNGHWIGRYWAIGPTQTMYVPGCWLNDGKNTVQVFDVIGNQEVKELKFLDAPILAENRSDLDYYEVHTRPKLEYGWLVKQPRAYEGAFKKGPEAQIIKFEKPVKGQYFAIRATSTHNGKPFAACSELDLFDDKGKNIPHSDWSIAAVSSEERSGEDGSAENAVDGQIANHWHSSWDMEKFPHYIVIDLGKVENVGGFKWTPRQTGENGRVKNFEAYVLPELKLAK